MRLKFGIKAVPDAVEKLDLVFHFHPVVLEDQLRFLRFLLRIPERLVSFDQLVAIPAFALDLYLLTDMTVLTYLMQISAILNDPTVNETGSMLASSSLADWTEI
jgi:hypothetical protein